MREKVSSSYGSVTHTGSFSRPMSLRVLRATTHPGAQRSQTGSFTGLSSYAFVCIALGALNWCIESQQIERCASIFWKFPVVSYQVENYTPKPAAAQAVATAAAAAVAAAPGMADEDALFAEFMGEIKSAVVEPAPAVGADGGAVPDAASVGVVSEGEGRGEAIVDTSKRRGGEVCIVYRATNARCETTARD